MRADAVGPRTWLLGAVAAWALCLWALGLFGLGGRIERLPDDPSLVQRLPRAPAATAERLGPLPQYDEIGARPLFNDDRRPQPFFINPDGEGEQGNAFDFVLTSVLLTPGFQMAIVQPTGGGESVRLKVGGAPESAPAWTLGTINPRSAVFNGPEGERTLELRVYDGTGGEPPTAMTGAPGGPTQPPVPKPSQSTQPVITKSSDQPPVATPTPSGEPPQPSEADIARQDQQAEQQAQAIRDRINARRSQLKQAAQGQAPSSTPPSAEGLRGRRNGR